MPLPLILGLGAAAAGALGLGTGIHGAVKMKDANDTMKLAEDYHEENINHFTNQNLETTKIMDTLGNRELEILNSFNDFSMVFEKIHNRPKFKEYQKDGVTIPSFSPEEIQKVSVGAGVLLGGLGGAALGTAGGFAAAGATTAAVMALGTASTGTAIATLSGAAATNATLAALGGGALAAGGGGMALGTTILGAATLGAGIMVGGILFNIVGSSLSNKADEAWGQVRKEREEVNKICDYLTELGETAKNYTSSITAVYEVYQKQFNILMYIVDTLKKTDWNDFSQEEKLVTENTALLVGLLYNMGKVELVLKSNDCQINTVNRKAVRKALTDAKTILLEKGFRSNDGADFDWAGDIVQPEDETAFDLTKVKDNWDEILLTVKEEHQISDISYKTWLVPLKPSSIKDNTITILVPEMTFIQFVDVKYGSLLKVTISQFLEKNCEVVFKVKS